jgi:hypothetical protein
LIDFISITPQELDDDWAWGDDDVEEELDDDIEEADDDFSFGADVRIVLCCAWVGLHGDRLNHPTPPTPQSHA